LAGSDSVYSAAFRQAGLLRVDDLDEIVHVSRALELLPLPNDNRVCIITFSGAAGAQAADLCIENGLTVPNLAGDTIAKIRGMSPPWMGISNPLDIWPAAERSGDVGKTYAEAINAALVDENVDLIIVLVNVSYTPVSQSPMPEELAEAVKTPLTKPVAICAIGYTWDVERYAEVLSKKMLPVYPTVKSCVQALSKLYQYGMYRKQT